MWTAPDESGKLPSSRLPQAFVMTGRIETQACTVIVSQRLHRSIQTGIRLGLHAHMLYLSSLWRESRQ